MARKLRFKWGDQTERTVFDIVENDGMLRSREILYMIARLCVLLKEADEQGADGQSMCIHPDNVLVSGAGDVRFAGESISPAAMERYLPPELEMSDRDRPAAKVYALGMLMLFMASGQDKKNEEVTSSVRPEIFALIRRCIAFDPGERFRDTEELLEAVRHETSLRKKMAPVLIAAVLACLAAAVFLFSWQRGTARGRTAGETSGYKPGFSEGFVQGFSDAPGISIHGAPHDSSSGNLPGNYASEAGTIAVSGDDAVFYISEDKISRMDPYTKDVVTLAEVPGAYGLQFYNGGLYYCTEEEILRMDLESGRQERICDSLGGQFFIFEDTFYLYDSAGTGYLYRIDPNQQSMTQLNGSMEYRCLQVVDGILYYISPEKGNSICRSDSDGGNESVISSSSFEDLCICRGTIYASTGKKLVRMDLNGGNLETLAEGIIHHLNVTDGGIFYTSGSSGSLEWMSEDKKTRYTIVTTHTGAFNVAEDWLFYRNEEDDGRLWRVRAGGTDNIRLGQ